MEETFGFVVSGSAGTCAPSSKRAPAGRVGCMHRRGAMSADYVVVRVRRIMIPSVILAILSGGTLSTEIEVYNQVSMKRVAKAELSLTQSIDRLRVDWSHLIGYLLCCP